MPEEQVKQQEKSKSDLFGGSLLLKIVFIIGLIVVVFVLIFGLVLKQFSFQNLLINVIGILIGGAIIYFALLGVMSRFKPKPFSPTEDFRTKIIRMAIKVKPVNVKDLWLRGEDMRSKARVGRIEGIGFIPYLSQVPKRDKEGNILYERDKEGKLIYEEYKERGEIKKKPKPQYDYLTEKDGDVLIVVHKFSGLLSLLNRELDLIRVNPKYLSDILGDVFIKDVNLVPYGEYLYPSKQWQNDILRIMKQHESEAIIMTHRNWLDLIANVTQLSLSSSPEFQKIMTVQSERLSNVSMGAGV